MPVRSVAFDDITIGAAVAGATAAIPECESILPTGLGVVALVAARRTPRR